MEPACRALDGQAGAATVNGREYDTSLLSTADLHEGQWVEIRVGRVTGILCGVVPMASSVT